MYIAYKSNDPTHSLNNPTPSGTMPLLSLPPELIFHILTFSPWPTILSFISTTKLVTAHKLSPSDLRLLRRNCAATLLAWETAAREERNWPLYADPVKGPWTTMASTYGESMYVFWAGEGDAFNYIPCYGCLRFREWSYFGSTMRSGGQMIGQVRAERRRCIPCGVRTGLYLPGAKVGRRAICVQCKGVMAPWNGHRFSDDNMLFTVPGRLPEGWEFENGVRGVDAEGNVTFSHAEFFEDYWWWTYSHMCAPCTVEAGYTRKELLHGKPIADRLVRRMKARHAEKKIASLERGREIRARRGMPEPERAVDIEALKGMDDPFPNFQPVPFIVDLPEIPPEVDADL